MLNRLYVKGENDPKELDILVSQIKARTYNTETLGVTHQVPFRIYQWNFEKVEALKAHLGNPTRNKLLNQLLEIALEEVFKKLEENDPEQLKEILILSFPKTVKIVMQVMILMMKTLKWQPKSQWKKV